jgi:hypothetical protein
MLKKIYHFSFLSINTPLFISTIILIYFLIFLWDLLLSLSLIQLFFLILLLHKVLLKLVFIHYFKETQVLTKLFDEFFISLALLSFIILSIFLLKELQCLILFASIFLSPFLPLHSIQFILNDQPYFLPPQVIMKMQIYHPTKILQ